MNKKDIFIALIVSLLLINNVSAQFVDGFFNQFLVKDFHSPYMNLSNETVNHIKVENGSVSDIQTLINNKADAGILYIHLSGVFEVKDAPITINKSRVVLFLENNASIVATPSTSASSLISIGNNAEYTAIKSNGNGVLNGNGANISGIVINQAGKCAIEKLQFKGLNQFAVNVTGRGLYADAISFFECKVDDCSNGLNIYNAPQFMVMNCVFQNISSMAIQTNSPANLIAHNVLDNISGIAIKIDVAKYGHVVRNEIKNSGMGITIGNSASEIMLTYNKLDANTTCFDLSGSNCYLYYNEISNNNNVFALKTPVGNNYIVDNTGILPSDINNSKLLFFDSPSSATDIPTEIVKSKATRILNFLSSANDDLQWVRTQIDAARVQYPSDVLVIVLDGTFKYRGNGGDLTVGFKIHEYECVVLKSGAKITGNGKSVASLVAFGNSTGKTGQFAYASLTGGTVDGLRNDFTKTGDGRFTGGLINCSFNGNDNVVPVIQGVNIINAVRTGVYSGGSVQKFIRACTVNNINTLAGTSDIGGVARGILSQDNRTFCFENRITNCGHDIIDFDVNSHGSVAMFNYGRTGTRHGVFIEEATENVLVYHNEFSSLKTAVLIHNNEVESIVRPSGNTPKTRQNLVVANKSSFMSTADFGVTANYADGKTYASELNTIAYNYGQSSYMFSGQPLSKQIVAQPAFYFQNSSSKSGDYFSQTVDPMYHKVWNIPFVSLISGNIPVKELNNNSIKVYPIPAKDFVTLERIYNDEIVTVQIYDAMGNLHYLRNIYEPKIQINLANYPAGIYFMQVRKDNGDSNMIRFIKL